MTTSTPDNWPGWMVLPLRRYAQFTGRSGRREFWSYSAFLMLGYVTIGGLAAASLDTVTDDDLSALFWVGSFGLFFLVNFVPGLALTTRRLHDMNLSGALLIVIFAGLLLLNFLGWLGYMLWMSLPGQRTQNRHGPPIGNEDVADVFS